MAKMHNTQGIAKMRYLEPERAVKAMEWMEAVLGKSYGVTPDDINNENYANFLGRPSTMGEEIIGIRDGIDLCELVVKLGSTTGKKVKTMKNPMFYRDNVQNFINALTKKFQLPAQDLMDTQDLVSHSNLVKVVDTIWALDKVADKFGYNGPRIPGNAKYATKNKREFSAEVLAKSKSAVPKMAKGGIYQKTSGQDGYGIVKTDKSMQNPSQVQSAWQKGANAVNNNNMDGYGIVKTDKSMQNPSQVQGAWQKGSYKVDNKGMDGYGIVKTDKSMQNPSQVQGVWAQGAKKVENNNMDGYGIVKTDKSMQNPSQVQGVWAQGAKKVDNKGMDSYGIVKTDKDMQQPSQVQGVWQQGAKKNESAGMDGYGVVKVDESMQNPSQVQGAWQQGANANENNNMDSYGVVKQSQD